ncbi:MAG: hypothetical protein Q4B28_03835 [bacterium]|nr:hypothetical protein [bacterium]
MSGDLAVPNNFPDPVLITTFNTFKAELALLTKKVEEASSTGEYNIIL